MQGEDRLWRESMLRKAVLAGDELAWRTWYDANQAALLRYAGWRCGQRSALTDEVAQETWMTAVRRIRDFDPNTGSFRNWLFGIAANVIRNALRKQKWLTSRSEPLNGRVDVAGVQSSPLPNSDKVAVALERLSARHEQVLRAKYLEELSVQQIAEGWNESPKAIESLLTRARDAFREIYSSEVAHHG